MPRKAPARKTTARKTPAQPKIKTVVVNPPTRKSASKTAKAPARKRGA